jgi:simple sugar transport system ATP-binding protein
MNEAHLGFVPGDRQRYGLVMSFAVEDNLILTNYYHAPYAKGLVRDDEAISKTAREAITEYDIRTPSEKVAVSTLSGGNQQKVIVAGVPVSLCPHPRSADAAA